MPKGEYSNLFIVAAFSSKKYLPVKNSCLLIFPDDKAHQTLLTLSSLLLDYCLPNGSGSGKINVLLNLIKHQRRNIDKIYLYFKDPFGSNYQLLINGREKVEIKKLKNSKGFIDYWHTIDDVYNDLIADMESN